MQYISTNTFGGFRQNLNFCAKEKPDGRFKPNERSYLVTNQFALFSSSNGGLSNYPFPENGARKEKKDFHRYLKILHNGASLSPGIFSFCGLDRSRPV